MARGNSVHNRRCAMRILVLDDMSGLEQLRLAEAANSAAARVRAPRRGSDAGVGVPRPRGSHSDGCPPEAGPHVGRLRDGQAGLDLYKPPVVHYLAGSQQGWSQRPPTTATWQARLLDLGLKREP
jgi:hypothetical protein